MGKGLCFIKNIKFDDSKNNVIIQLADMVAGAIRKSYQDNDQVSKNCLKKISNKKLDIWEFK